MRFSLRDSIIFFLICPMLRISKTTYFQATTSDNLDRPSVRTTGQNYSCYLVDCLSLLGAPISSVLEMKWKIEICYVLFVSAHLINIIQNSDLGELALLLFDKHGTRYQLNQTRRKKTKERIELYREVLPRGVVKISFGELHTSNI